MRKKVIAYLYRIPMGTILLWLFHRIIGHNRISLSKNNHFDSSTSNIYKNKIVAVNCAGNSIVIGHNSDLHNSEILIKGTIIPYKSAIIPLLMVSRLLSKVTTIQLL